MKILYWFLFVISCVVIFVMITLSRVPAEPYLSDIALPKQLQISQIGGNIYGGSILTNISDQNLSIQLQLQWDWCPLQNFSLSQFCITVISEGLHGTAQLNWFDEDAHQGVEISNLVLDLQAFSLSHPVWSNITVDGQLLVEQLMIDFNTDGLHRIHTLKSQSPELLVKMLSSTVDKGALTLDKTASTTMQGQFDGTGFKAGFEGFVDGRLDASAQMLNPAKEIRALANFVFKDDGSYHYQGRWF